MRERALVRVLGGRCSIFGEDGFWKAWGRLDGPVDLVWEGLNIAMRVGVDGRKGVRDLPLRRRNKVLSPMQ